MPFLFIFFPTILEPSSNKTLTLLIVPSSKLLLKNGKVAVAPGIGFGINGEGFVRIGLVENENRIRQAIKNVKLFFDKYESNS